MGAAATQAVECPVQVSTQLRDAIERALDTGGRAVHRLGSAQTSVAFQIGDDERASVTMLLDRHPPVVRAAGEPAEVTISMTAEQGRRFLTGQLRLPNELLRGSIAWRGPVRKYLSYDPVLRSLLERVQPG